MSVCMRSSLSSLTVCVIVSTINHTWCSRGAALGLRPGEQACQERASKLSSFRNYWRTQAILGWLSWTWRCLWWACGLPRIITTKPVMLEDVTGSRTSVFRLSDDCHICEPTQICDQNGAPVVRLLLLLSFGRCQTGSTCGCWFVMVPYLFWLFGQKYAHGWSLCMGSCSWAGCR